MIPAKDIQKKALTSLVRDIQIEKDYVLTWVLCGISRQNHLCQSLAFKGGTVLKKVYFESYRYSEDLDFTLLNDQLTEERLINSFKKVFHWVLEKANIPLEITKNHVHKSGSINFHIGYVGPLGGQGMHKRLKVDITRGEHLEFVPVQKQVFISYDDMEPFSLLCYPLEEVLIEKMCALMGRTEPRDLYDLWYLLEIKQLKMAYYWTEFSGKAQHKGHDTSQFISKVEGKTQSFKARWEGSLSSQIHELPPFDRVIRELGKHFRALKMR